MARPNRSDIVVPAQPVHVIIRGNNRRRLFSYPSDFKAYLRRLARAADKHEVALHAGAWISNHGHLIATPPTVEALSWCMHSASQGYAMERNARRGGSGKLYEERFRSWPVRDEDHERRLYAYIDLNPVKAGLVRHPRDYPWSTYRILVGDARRSAIDCSMWTMSPFWLAIGPEAYAAWVEQHVARPVALLDADPNRDAILRADSASDAYGRRLERPDGTRAR